MQLEEGRADAERGMSHDDRFRPVSQPHIHMKNLSEREQVVAAEARVAVERGTEYLEKLCGFFSTYYKATTLAPGSRHLELPHGGIWIRVEGNLLILHAEAAELGALATLKDVLATYLEKFAAAERPQIVWTGDGCNTSALPNFRELRVKRAGNISPHMRRVTLAGENLARFGERGLHARLVLPPAGHDAPEWPTMGRNGRIVWPCGDQRPVTRTYTIRRIDAEAGEIDIDFVMHRDEGVASRWAAAARTGDLIGILGPGGGTLPAAGWYLFACDETGLPAAGRMLEMLPRSVRGKAFFEVADAEDIQTMNSKASIDVIWLFRNGAARGTATLLQDAVQTTHFPRGETIFAWAAAEASTAKTIRSIWADVRIEGFRSAAAGYWKLGRSEDDYRAEAD